MEKVAAPPAAAFGLKKPVGRKGRSVVFVRARARANGRTLRPMRRPPRAGEKAPHHRRPFWG